MERFNTSTLVKILEDFRKKHPGILKLKTQLRVTWVEEITQFRVRDKVWKEPAIVTKSGAIYKFNEVYSGIFIEDYYDEPCPVIRYDKDNPDEFQYYLNVPIHISRELYKGDAMVAYLPHIKPHHCSMNPHHILLGTNEELEEIYSAKDTNTVLSCFSQGVKLIANRFIYPSGYISRNDPDDMYGYVLTLIIL